MLCVCGRFFPAVDGLNFQVDKADHFSWMHLFSLQQIKPDFSNFDEAGAWPYLMDEFVDFMKVKNGMANDN
jgi:hypothetical protein